MYHPRPLKGHIALKLIRELAVGTATIKSLADKYEVTESAIHTFRNKHRDEIDEVKANFEDEFAGIWIANKANRLAEYKADVERANEMLDLVGDEPLMMAPMFRLKQNALKSVAEELGQLPSKVSMNIEEVKVHVDIEGVDMSSLK